MKRALIITYYWPPSGGSGVQRWVKFAKYLPSEGWQPVIYTPENPELIAIDNTLEAEIPEETEIIRRPIFEPYGIYRRLTGKKGAPSDRKNEVNPINGNKKSFGQRLMMAIRGNFFMPDPRCFWIGPSVRFLKKYLKEHPADVIVSTGPPHSMHLIARKVAAATGIPWVADFRDPWTRMFYFKHLRLSRWAERQHHRLEKQVLDNASVVVAVSPLVQKEFSAMTTTPVELITNGFDETDFLDAETSQDGMFSIVHTGLFASDGNPEVLLEVLEEKCLADHEFKVRLRIRTVGKTDSEIIRSIADHGLGDNLEDFGYQPHSLAVKAQKNATLLMLPLRKEPEYRATLPGKLFEYIASGRPILGIGQTDGAMAMILDSTKTGVVFDWNDKESVAKYMEICWSRFKDGTLEVSPENISQFSRKELTGKMVALFETLITKKSEDKARKDIQ